MPATKAELELKKPVGDVATMRGLVADARAAEKFRKLLGDLYKPEQMAEIALNCFQKRPKLKNCSRDSILQALFNVAAIRLFPDTPLQHAHLVPYKSDCVLQLGYRGFLELIRRHNPAIALHTNVVRDGDDFSVSQGTDRSIRHNPSLEPGAHDRPMTFVYACVQTRNGPVFDFEYMDRSQVDAIRKRSRASSDGPWVTDFDEMARKTVLRRLCKRLPMSEAFRKAEEFDNESFRVAEFKELTDPETLAKNKALAAKTREKYQTEIVGDEPAVDVHAMRATLRDHLAELERRKVAYDFSDEIDDLEPDALSGHIKATADLLK